MRVFVTGGTGFFGAHLLTALSAAGHEVTALARHPERLPRRPGLPGLRLLAGDLAHVDALRPALEGHDALVHAALRWEAWPAELTLADPTATSMLTAAATEAAVHRLVYVSSTAVHRPFRALIHEDTPLAPPDLYGATKAASELYVRAIAAQAGAVAHLLRAGPMVGPPAWPGAPLKVDGRIRAMWAAALAGAPIPVPAGGVQLVDVRDVADLVVRLLAVDEGGPLLCVEGEPRSWRSIAELVRGRVGRGELTEAEEAEEVRFDTARLRALLGRELCAERGLEAVIAGLAAG